MTENCIFCKIYKSGNVLFENKHLFLVSDIGPLAKGHLLLIPKIHCQFLHELSDEVLEAILPTLKMIITKLGYEKYNILNNNGHIQSVFHVHFHLIPANDIDDQLSINWERTKIESDYSEKLNIKVKQLLKE